MAVIFTVVRRVRSGVGASAWAQSAVVATASLAIVLVCLSRRLAFKSCACSLARSMKCLVRREEQRFCKLRVKAGYLRLMQALSQGCWST